MNELYGKLKNISKDIEIIAYWLGPFCVLAIKFIKYTEAQGYKVFRFDEDYLR